MYFLRDVITAFLHYQFILFSFFLDMLSRKRNFHSSIMDSLIHIFYFVHIEKCNFWIIEAYGL